jgi:PAS domain S-box-containing protein
MPLTAQQLALIRQASKDDDAYERLLSLFKTLEGQGTSALDLWMLRAVLDTIPDRIYVKDRDGRFMLANRAAWSEYDLPNEQALLGKTDIDLFPDGGQSSFEEEQQMLQNGGSIINFEYRHPERSAWSERPYVHVTKVPLHDDHGDVIGLVGVNRDITDLKRIEEELRQNQLFAVQVTLAMPDVVFVQDLVQNANIYCNDQAVNLLGYSPEQIQAMGSQFLPTVMHPEDWLRYREHARNYHQMQDSDVAEFEYRMCHADGAWRWLLSREMIFKRAPEGTPLQVLGVLRDITGHKRAEAVLRQNEAQKQALINAIPDMIIELNADGVVFNLKYHAGMAVQVSSSHYIGQTLDALYPPPLAEQLLMLTRRALATGQAQRWEYDSPLSDENTLREARIVAVDRERALIISRDITERKAMEQSLIERERLQAALQKEQELSLLKSRMMTRISHEFRTPLSVIMASTELIWHYGPRLSSAQREDHFQRIQAEIRSIAEILRSIALIMQTQPKPAALETKPCDLQPLVTNVVEQLSSEVGVQRRLHITVDGDVRLLPSDEISLQRLIYHLLLNALKYSPAESPVCLQLARQGPHIRLSVIDHGIGIPEADQPRVFEPFFRGSNVGDISGMGLGLALVKHAVEVHEGSIILESAVRRGTTVTVKLPTIL